MINKRKCDLYIIMNKLKKVFWFLSISFLALNSCAKDELSKIKLLKSIVETTADGTSQTTFFTYNGAEIASIDNDQKHLDFTYTSGLITKIDELNKTNQLRNTIEYSYIDGQLVRTKSLNNYIINYIHNSDGTILYEKLGIDSRNQEVKMYHGKLFFQNKNFIRDERILDNTESGVLSDSSISFEYDAKNNPFNTILGYSKLLDRNERISLNNSTISTVITNTTKDSQVTSSANFYLNSFKYDLEGYPTEKVSENALLNNGKYGYLKWQYFYK